MGTLSTLRALSKLCKGKTFAGSLDQPHRHVDGLAQDYSNSIANALELLQACAKPSMRSDIFRHNKKQVYLPHIYKTDTCIYKKNT